MVTLSGLTLDVQIALKGLRHGACLVDGDFSLHGDLFEFFALDSTSLELADGFAELALPLEGLLGGVVQRPTADGVQLAGGTFGFLMGRDELCLERLHRRCEVLVLGTELLDLLLPAIELFLGKTQNEREKGKAREREKDAG